MFIYFYKNEICYESESQFLVGVVTGGRGARLAAHPVAGDRSSVFFLQERFYHVKVYRILFRNSVLEHQIPNIYVPVLARLYLGL